MRGALKTYHVWPNKETVAAWKAKNFDPPRHDVNLKPIYGIRQKWPSNSAAREEQFTQQEELIDVSWVDNSPFLRGP